MSSYPPHPGVLALPALHDEPRLLVGANRRRVRLDRLKVHATQVAPDEGEFEQELDRARPDPAAACLRDHGDPHLGVPGQILELEEGDAPHRRPVGLDHEAHTWRILARRLGLSLVEPRPGDGRGQPGVPLLPRVEIGCDLEQDVVVRSGHGSKLHRRLCHAANATARPSPRQGHRRRRRITTRTRDRGTAWPAAARRGTARPQSRAARTNATTAFA